ncbi:MAG: family 20 glycosylhydrolase [Thermoanaerobaculia bacterium]
MKSADPPASDLLWPRPREIVFTGDAYRLGESPVIAAAADGTPALPAAQLVRDLEAQGFRPRSAAAPADADVSLVIEPGIGPSPESYRLEIRRRRITVAAATGTGLFRGVTTLTQWIRLHRRAGPDPAGTLLPGLEVRDWPGFEHRGVLLDVSRNKVPTLATLRRLIDFLASLKINQLQLYTEHTFAYRGHRTVWRGWSPLRPHEIRYLDAYCRQRCIELVPNQNSFGHLHRWLIHSPYRRLAERPEGFLHPFSPDPEPFSLCPVDPGSLDLLRDLYAQLLPNFSSRLFNVGLDETLDLGSGRSAAACAERGRERVYLDFLTEVYDLVATHGRRMLFWGDVILQRPELIAELPGDAIALEWGYEADHPFDRDCRRFAAAGLEFWVCPGTSAWSSFAGRTSNALENLARAATHGHTHGSRGYLICDWGDHGHLQPLPVSFPGFVAGAGFSWNTSSTGERRQLPLARLVDLHAFGDRDGVFGRAIVDLGDAYLRTGARSVNGSALFFLLMFAGKPAAERRCQGITVESLEKTRDFVDRTMATGAGGGRTRRELDWVADVLRVACRLGIGWLETGFDRPLAALPVRLRKELSSELEDLAARQRRIWLGRYRPGGLEASLKRFLAVRDLLGG